MGRSRQPAARTRQSRQDGFSLPIAVVAALLLLIGLAALGARSTQGFLASVFQGVNREARDVAESAITDFAVTLNREENRRLLVAGNDQLGQWSSNAAHRNPCSGNFQPSNPPSGQLVAVLGTAQPTTASRFVKSTTWQNLSSGDSSRQFLVEDVRYRYENRLAGSARTDFDFATPDANIPTHSVRNAALQGGTRTLLRVTIQGRVMRNGQTSLARVTREFEVVPKCCKRSFGKHSGLGAAQSDPAWGSDPVQECPLALDDGAGRGIVGSLSGGEPSSSNNTLDIADERGNLITRALCWAGNESASSDLSGSPSASCLSGQQALGRASKSKPGITFVPTPFDLVLPRPQFGDGPGSGFDAGWIGTPSGVQTVALLNASYPGASFGNWVVTNGGKYWMKSFGSWTLFDTKVSTAPAFGSCTSGTTDFGVCRTEPFMGSAPYPRADSQPFRSWSSVFPVSTVTISGNSLIYLDPSNLTMKLRPSSGPDQNLTNCIVSKNPTAPYAVADCRFRDIASGNQVLTVDTTFAVINFHFDEPTFTGEYMGGNGNTSIRRVHCSRVGYSAGNCNDVVTWDRFQRKCDPNEPLVANRDPNCGIRNNAYDHSELFNAFATGPGRFTLNGTSATVGVNVYAPRATVELIGGGNANPNFMGRVWTNVIVINGNTTMRSPVSNPSFCANHRCPPPAKIPLYDMIARSFSHASGF